VRAPLSSRAKRGWDAACSPLARPTVLMAGAADDADSSESFMFTSIDSGVTTLPIGRLVRGH
jgi:hypothetical protein